MRNTHIWIYTCLHTRNITVYSVFDFVKGKRVLQIRDIHGTVRTQNKLIWRVRSIGRHTLEPALLQSFRTHPAPIFLLMGEDRRRTWKGRCYRRLLTLCTRKRFYSLTLCFSFFLRNSQDSYTIVQKTYTHT